MMIFSDFTITPEKAKCYIADLEAHPEKRAKYKALLTKNLAEQFKLFKDKEIKEQISMLQERTQQWKKMVGPISIQEFLSIGQYWKLPVDSIIDQRITPELIKKMLDFYLIGQEQYKIKLSISFYTFLLNRKSSFMSLPKSNLLVCGPSGSGKTYGMQVLSQLFHVPFTIVHCNSLVQEGIVGTSITDAVTSLYEQGWSANDIEHTVYCFDEFDKLFEKTPAGSETGAYNARIINELLNVIDDDGEVEFRKHYEQNSEKIKVSSKKMMFVFTGVFDGLKNRPSKTGLEDSCKEHPIGFLTSFAESTPRKEETNGMKMEPSIDDYVAFGVKPEILGRIRNFVYLDELSVEDLESLFDLGASSPFSDFEQYFAANEINASITEEGKHVLAKMAFDKKLGVRGLKGLLQKVLTEDMYDLEVGPDKTLKITEQYILDNLK